MDSLLNLRTFLAACRNHSFSEASRQLHVVPSVVAKRIAQLEKTVGARLFERTTRRVVLTPAGERLQQRAAAVVADFDAVLDGFRRDDAGVEGHIALVAPTTLTLTVLGPLLNRFLLQHPRITLEMSVSDRTTNPLESGQHIAISGRTASYADVVAVPLYPTQRVACASPHYVERHGPPAHPRELDRHACIVFRGAGASWRFRGWRGPALVDVRARLLVEDHLTALDAARRGLGVAVLPGYVARAALSRGELVALLPNFVVHEEWFTAQVPERLLPIARVRTLVDWVAEQLGPACEAWVEPAARQADRAG